MRRKMRQIYKFLEKHGLKGTAHPILYICAECLGYRDNIFEECCRLFVTTNITAPYESPFLWTLHHGSRQEPFSSMKHGPSQFFAKLHSLETNGDKGPKRSLDGQAHGKEGGL